MKSRLSIAVLALALLAVPTALAGEYSDTMTFDSDSLIVRNLIGEVDVKPGGSQFEVTVHVRGADADRDAIEFDQDGDELRLVFPDAKKFVYPKLGNGKMNFSMGDGEGSLLGALFGRGRRIQVSGRGSGLELWADVEIKVPDGAELKVYHGAGDVSADGVEGTLTLDTHSGEVNTNKIYGDLLIDTGSGAVTVSSVRGELFVDTGSGRVDAADIDGPEISIDTGSGSVSLTRAIVTGDVTVDTGSGRVMLDDVEGEEFTVDTGSGSVTARAVRAEAMTVDTGSGSVELELSAMGSGDFDVDTGSGGIVLALPTNASATVYAESNSGVALELDDVRKLRKDDDEMSFVVGGGDARVNLEAGSGRVRIVPLGS